MKTSFISNIAIQSAMRLTISTSQNEVQNLQKEIVTGRYADIGVALGAGASRSVALNRDLLRLDNIKDSNALATQRLSASQGAMTLMADNAQSMLEAFITVTSTDDAGRLGIAKRDVQTALEAFTGAINTSSNGEYVFSGINTDARPLANYFDPASPAQAAFDSTFQSHFGFAKTDPLVSGITPAQMEDFITNTLEPSFTGTDWTTNWSSASDTNVTSRITRNDLIESTTNANTAGMRSFALAAVIGLELLGMPLASDTRAVVNTKAMEYAGAAVSGIDNERSRLGLSEARVAKANVSLEAQIKIVQLHVNSLEEVDAYEASTRMNSLLAQVETSYKLTSRIQQLSLSNYL
ncbi:flagellar hook-associated protein 3 FlgL [Hoeflea marina]|uniref:Flagellin n=1 Tax=Hoeflea marina TaxID=274592 RepID=A0A317PBP6_9HYPH|nr:flagellar hook-associated family protein [Hoeflea marina]PWV95253.1 flagellar hook-associated protein 3 FlgL [Hoeflea marina]